MTTGAAVLWSGIWLRQHPRSYKSIFAYKCLPKTAKRKTALQLLERDGLQLYLDLPSIHKTASANRFN
jgi:hypothetical protein